MISSPDKQSHFKSLLQLLELSESNELYEFVLNNSEQEIQEKLLTYEFKN
jgi:DNA-binding protein Fis